ncbi:MAG: glycine cleavage system aminomethyltransferase GcvT [Conexivisphaerales archaeon]
MVKQTQLFPAYRDRAKLTEFAGYLMPLYFKGIIEETLAVRNAVGIFDVSHMGRIKVSGKESTVFLNRLLTANIEKGEVGRAMYGFMCNQQGGIIDDLITYKLSDQNYTIVVNCANREKDISWMKSNSVGLDVSIQDVTDQSVLLAVQGPLAAEVLDRFSDLKRFRFTMANYDGNEMMVARTGYTGEDGFELMLEGVTHANPDMGLRFYSELVERIIRRGGSEAGLGARDTLRLEAGLPLHGQDIAEDVTPIEAGLNRFLDLEKSYIGSEVHRIQNQSVQRRLVGLVAKDDCIPRAHHKVYLNGVEAGVVTSGTYSPILKKGIAMAMIQSEALNRSNIFEIEVRGKMCKAEIHQFPFYDVEVYGYRRKQQSKL